MGKELKKIAAIYCRVSTQEQAEEGYSIGEQERLLKEYCEKHGYEVFQVYVDAGISGKDIKHRPAIQQLLKDAAERKFSLVLTWKINRLSRKLLDAIKIVETLEAYGIVYQSYSEPFESSTPAGKMQFQMLALVGEFERNTIAQNVKMGMMAKARSGEWCGGIPPLGYQWVPMEGTEHLARKKSRLAIDEAEAAVVHMIFELYASGKGYKAIVGHLNKSGYRTKLNNYFSVAQLKTILTNPVYVGKVRYNVRRDWNEKRRNNINPNPIIADGIHMPIISEELWDRVQFMISQKTGKPSRIYDGEYPLTGILKCPVCGAGMVISRVISRKKDGSKKKLTYYACGNWKNKGTAVCHSNMVRVETANEFVYHQLDKILSNEKFFNEIVYRVNREHKITKNNAYKAKTLQEKEVEKIKYRQNKNFESYEDGLISKDEFLERKSSLNRELEQIRNQRNETDLVLMEEERKEIPPTVIRGILQEFSKILLSDIDHTIRKRLLHLLISEITIDKERKIDSIKLKLSDDLIKFLQDNGGTPPTGGASSLFMLNGFGITTMDLELVI